MAAEDPETVAFSVYGSHVRIAVPHAELSARVAAQLPVHAERCEPGPEDRHLALERTADNRWELTGGDKVLARTCDVDAALTVLRRQLAFFAMDHALDHLVVSAGAVGYHGRMIVLPAPTMAGKSTLVAALLSAGADYYTDDWTILDPDGLVRPFSRSLRIRRQGWIDPKSLGAKIGTTPLPVALIAKISYVHGSAWQPESRTAAQGLTMLLGHAYGMDDPAAAMSIARRAVAHAHVIEGERGEAAECAQALLELVAQLPVPTSG